MQGMAGSYTTKILSTKIWLWAEFGKTAKYLILENFRLYGSMLKITSVHSVQFSTSHVKAQSILCIEDVRIRRNKGDE